MKNPSSAEPEKSPGPWTHARRKLLRNKVACSGGVILFLLYLTACLAGFLSPYDWKDASPDSSGTGPMLLGAYELREFPSDPANPDAGVRYERRWRWFRGGVHFSDSNGEFTLRPHVHPVVELYTHDEHGQPRYIRGCIDPTVSVPVQFFVSTPEEHEVVSALGFAGVRGTSKFAGVTAPPGTVGSVGLHFFGTDTQGRDLFTRILFGAQISLSVGIVCIVVTMFLGMLIGGLSGYFAGTFDSIAMRVVEVVLSVPDLYLIIVLGGVFLSLDGWDGEPLSSRTRYLMILLAMALVGWAGRARVIRGMVMSLRTQDYVVSAQALGLGTLRILALHILPNTVSFAIVSATLAVPGYILGEVGLSFLGLGIQEPEASWGNMLREAQSSSTLLDSPWVIVPGVFIFLTVLAYNFLGDGLRDALDPRAVILSKAQKAAAKKA